MNLNINFQRAENGIIANVNGQKFHLVYPNDFWKDYPEKTKEAFIDNIAHLLTINAPLIAGIKKVKYNTARPIFKPFFDEVIKKSMRHAVEDYDQSAEEVLKQFSETKYEFSRESPKQFPSESSAEFDEKSMNLLSFGKDSMTSFAVCKEIGLNPSAIYVNETVSPSEHAIKLDFIRRFSKDIGTDFFVIRNELERLNDFEFWGKDETCVGYNHMITAFCFLTLPIINKVSAKYIVLGNEQDLNFQFKAKDGTMSHPSYDQSIEWTLKLDKMIKEATAKLATVMSVIETLTNIATVKILHTRYPEIGKYQTSCSCLDQNDEKRWCHECNDCAKNVLYMKAFNIDIKRVGLRNILLDRKNKKYFIIFNGKEADCYDKSPEAREQQLLAFLLAYKNGHRGQLIDLFKKKFLEEAKDREEELRKKFFRIYKSETMPRKIEHAVTSIYKEELFDFA